MKMPKKMSFGFWSQRLRLVSEVKVADWTRTTTVSPTILISLSFILLPLSFKDGMECVRVFCIVASGAADLTFVNLKAQ